MKHPTGAIKTTEEMEAVLGKHVFMCAPSCLSTRMKFVAPNVGILHPTRIEINGKENGVPDHHKYQFMLHVEEAVAAAAMNAIAVRSHWRVRWMVENPLYFFSNVWFAYAHVQQRNDLGAQ